MSKHPIFDSETRSVTRRGWDLLNSNIVRLVLFLRVIFHAIVKPHSSYVLPLSEPTKCATLVLFVAGLGGPSYFWRPVVQDLRSWYPSLESKRVSIRTVDNVSALYQPMLRDRSECTLPMVIRHCNHWGSRTRLVLIGHSLGGVDVVWLGNAIRERYGAQIPLLTVSICGAFGTNLAPALDGIGAHPSLKQSIYCREGTFMQNLIHQARTLPHHPESEQLFVMSRDDRTIVPPTNSLLGGIPGKRNRHISVDGAGHTGAVAAVSPLVLETVSEFSTRVM